MGRRDFALLFVFFKTAARRCSAIGRANIGDIELDPTSTGI